MKSRRRILDPLDVPLRKPIAAEVVRELWFALLPDVLHRVVLMPPVAAGAVKRGLVSQAVRADAEALGASVSLSSSGCG
jgi:hypothetical protein